MKKTSFFKAPYRGLISKPVCRGLLAAAALLCCAAPAFSQNTIAVSASHIQGLSGTLLVSGSLCFQGTDQNNNLIAFQIGGGGAVVTSPFCTSVTNGVITTFNVPNPATTSPANVRYHIQVKQGARVVGDFPGAYLCLASGACTSPYTFNFDNCFSSGACIANPVPIVSSPVAGPAGPTGPSGPTGPAGIITSNSGALIGGPAVILGPNPWADITHPGFGARAVSGAAYSTATCTASSPNVTLGAASTFQNGDGITLLGCGPTLTLSTPAAPTVTPSLAVAGTGLGGGSTGGLVVNSGTGSSTYHYKVIFRDKFGGYTAPSAATTITNGLASLGLGSCTISTYVRSGTSVTVDFTAPCAAAVVQTRVHITGTTNTADFVGWYNVATVNSTSEVVLTNTPISSAGLGWQAGDTANGTGGVAKFYTSNHLQMTYQTDLWEAYICVERPGDSSYARAGVTKPSINSGFQDIQYDDYGSPYNDSQTYPFYITDALCNSGTARNDPLTTTIVSGGGTTSLVLADVATNASSGLLAVQDAGPGMKAAANSIAFGIGSAGTLYIPPTASGTSFVVYSYTELPPKIVIKQAGALTLNETLAVGNMSWDGDWCNSGDPQFSMNGGCTVSVGTANPGIYVSSVGTRISHVTFNTSNTNGGTIALVEGGMAAFTWDNFNTNPGVTADYLSTALVFRSLSTGGDNYFLDNSLVNSGPNQVLDKSWTPGIYLPPNQDGTGALLGNQNYFMTFKGLRMGIRGIEEAMYAGTAGTWYFDGMYRQGGITPFISLWNGTGQAGGLLKFSNTIQDTESVGTVVLGTKVGSGTVFPYIAFDQVQNGSVDYGSSLVPPPISGTAPLHVYSNNSSVGRLPTNAGYGTCVKLSSLFCMNDPMVLGINSYVYSPLAAPSTPTATLAAGAGVANDTYQFRVTAVGADGRETVGSPASNAITTNSGAGNSQITVNGWTNAVGTISNNLYVCGNFGTCAGNDYRLTATGIVTGTYTFSHDNSSVNPPSVSSAGTIVMDSTGIYGLSSTLASPLGAAGVSYKAKTVPGALTAARTYTLPDKTGTYAMTSDLPFSGTTGSIGGSALIAGQCASGTVSVSGAATSMTVSVSPNTYPGDGFIPWAYVSSSGTVTVKVCAAAAGTPTSSTYNVRVIQ